MGVTGAPKGGGAKGNVAKTRKRDRAKGREQYLYPKRKSKANRLELFSLGIWRLY